jgi:hypothetical protein
VAAVSLVSEKSEGEQNMNVTTIEEAVVENLRLLPQDKQQEVLDFVLFLQQKPITKHPRRSLLGALAHLNIHVTAEDIAESRREMWGEYMRNGE